MRTARTRSAALAGAAAAVVLAGVSGAVAAGPRTLEQQAGALAAQRRSAVLDLYALESKVHAAQQRLAALQGQARTLGAQARELQQQAVATRATLAVSQHTLAMNLRRLYKQGDVSALAVMLGSKSLDEALSKLDSLNAVADQSEQVVSATTAARGKLSTLRVKLAQRRARLDAALTDAQRTVDTLAAARANRVAFIAKLRDQERLKAAQIRALEARAQAAQQKSASLQQAADPAPVTVSTDAATAEAPADTTPRSSVPAAASPGGRTIVVSSTGYSLSGHTATGLPTGWGVVAVDPSVIPLGTKLTIPGYGEAVAADTGPAVRGREIDIWFPSLGQARAWGRRTVTITLH